MSCQCRQSGGVHDSSKNQLDQRERPGASVRHNNKYLDWQHYNSGRRRPIKLPLIWLDRSSGAAESGVAAQMMRVYQGSNSIRARKFKTSA